MPSAEIHRLQLAIVKLPTVASATSEIEVFAYLINHPSGLYLLDTGVGTGHPVVDERFEPEHRPVAESLHQLGCTPQDITAIINSHLHFDHCGNNRLFAGIPTYIQRREFVAARQPRYTVPQWFDFEGARIELVDDDRTVAPGLHLLATPGHTPGHQSVMIDTDEGLKIIAAQAALTAEEFERGGDVSEAYKGLSKAYLKSIARIKSLVPKEVYFSHDRATWRPSG